MKPIEITMNNFETEVMKSDKPVVIDFWAVWCGPCQMLHPVIEELAEENPDVKFCKINVDEQPELAAKYNVMSIPTLLLIKEGKVAATNVGFRPKADLVNFIRA